MNQSVTSNEGYIFVNIVSELPQLLQHVIVIGNKSINIISNVNKTCQLGQMIRFIHHGLQILPLWARITTQISHAEWNKHCSHTDKYEIMNIYSICIWLEINESQMEKKSGGMDCQQEKKTEQQRSECIWTILDLSPLSFSFSLHPPPFLLTRIIFHFRCNLPPSSRSFFLSFSASLSPCQLMFSGISVAGPHPSQTTAWMVPCSVQSSALQFCHNEH